MSEIKLNEYARIHRIITEAVTKTVAENFGYDEGRVGQIIGETVEWANKYLSPIGLSLKVDDDYGDWKNVYGGHAIGAYEYDSVNQWEGEIHIGINLTAVEKFFIDGCKKGIDAESEWGYVDDQLTMTICHEMAHGIIDCLRDRLEQRGNDERLLSLYDEMKWDFDYCLGKEEKAAEGFGRRMVNFGTDYSLQDIVYQMKENGIRLF